MKLFFACALALAFTPACFCATEPVASQPTVYLAPDNGFDTYIGAAFIKKNVPLTVVVDKNKADYILTPSTVSVKKQSTGSVWARCLLAYCAGIQDSAHVSVQLIQSNSSAQIWAYTVGKGRGSAHNQQSMAEAIAKHLKQYLQNHPLATPKAVIASVQPK